MTTRRPACFCGCGDIPESARSRFLPGHDGKLAHKVAKFMDEHGIADVDELLRQVAPRRDPSPRSN